LACSKQKLKFLYGPIFSVCLKYRIRGSSKILTNLSVSSVEQLSETTISIFGYVCLTALSLLDEMCNLVSKNYRGTVRKEGLKFFAGLNYNRTKVIKSPIIRLRTYLMVYRKFDYVYSPIKYLKYPYIFRRIPFIKKLIT